MAGTLGEISPYFTLMNRKVVNDFVKSLLKEEVSNVCPLCGNFEKTGSELTNHHINHDPSKSVYWNLIRICAACHEDLTKYKTDGTREKRVKFVKQRLFRNFFGPAAVSALKLAYEKEGVTVSPATVKELCDWNFIKVVHPNVLTVGPATNVATLSTYALTESGKEMKENLF